MRNLLLFSILFLWLGFLVFIAYGKSLGLSLYGDDWLTISKYYGAYGPNGRAGGYFEPSLIFSNYGSQFLTMGLAYALFKDNSTPYFIVSLFSRTLVAFALYYFAKKLISEKVGFIAASLFAVSSIGAETTDWVYNFSSYLGIFIAFLGLTVYISRASNKQLMVGLLLIIFGYMTSIIRLFILPILLFVLEFFHGILDSKLNFKKFLKAILFSFLAFSPFFLIKIIFPGLGFQQINEQLLSEGYKLAQTFISKGQWDFIITPFTNLGIMLAPNGFQQFKDLFIQDSPKKTLLFGYVFLFIMGSILISSGLKNIDRLKVMIAAVLAFFSLIFLKIFLTTYHSILNGFLLLSWTYLGLIFFIICIILLVRAFKDKNKQELSFYLVGIVLTFSFLFPWSYIPGSISSAIGRYNIVPSVGIVLVISGFLSLQFSKMKALEKLRYMFQLLILLSFFSIQVISSNQYFSYQLSSRNRELNDTLFSQIKAAVPKLPTDQAPLFYFEHNQPLVYENLLRFGFGYHMQLLYNIEFNDPTHPFSIGSKEDLIQAMTNPEYTKRLGYKIPPIDHVFAFRLIGDRLISITPQIRNYLYDTVGENSAEYKKLNY